MTKLGTAYVEVEADLNKLTRNVRSKMAGIGDDAGRRFSRSFSSKVRPDTFKTIAKGAGVAAAAIGAGLVVEVKKSVEAFTETEKVAKNTNQVLKTTGGVAGVSAKEVGRLATQISRKTGIDDEAVQSAENLLLTFTNVRNEVGKNNDIFSRSTRLVEDMSVSLGQDAKSSAIQLGKALNDPIKGVTALQRVGVSFTAQQRDQIKTLVESGKTLDAQKIILREVNKEFGGQAAAQAQPLDRLKVSVGNIQEAIGSGFKPAVDSVATSLDNLAVRALPKAQQAADDVAKTFQRKDLDLGDKITISTRKLRRDLGPVAHDIVGKLRAELKAADLGEKVGDVIDEAAPKVADAFAAAAPKAAEHFVSAFRNASPWGQLLTVAFLTKKLGGFSAAGRAASGLFSRGLAGKATSAVGALKPVPVFVTNKGFDVPDGHGPAGPVPVPKTKITDVVKTGGKALIAAGAGEAGAVALPLLLADFANRRSKLSQQAAALNQVLPAGRENLARQLDAAVKAGSPEKLRKVAAAIELTAQDMRGMGSASKSASRDVFAAAGQARDLAKAEDQARDHANKLARSIRRVGTDAGDVAARKIHQLHDEISDLPTNVRVNIIANAVRNFGRNIPAEKKSLGGIVHGTGSGDKYPHLLEAGEYVLRKGAVQRIGVRELDRLNRGLKGKVTGKISALDSTFEQPFQRLDDVFLGSQAGLRAALARAEVRRPGVGRVVGSPLQVELPRFHPATVGDKHFHITAPAGQIPDGKYVAQQIARELERRP